MAETKEFLGTGRRKTAVARVRLSEGTGKLIVNGRAFDRYFSHENFAKQAYSPLLTVAMREKFDVTVNVSGTSFAGPNIYLGDNSDYYTSDHVFLSADNGGTFNVWNSGLSSAPITTVYSIVLKGSYLFLGTNNGVYKATAGTNSWTSVSTGTNGMPTATSVKSLFVSGTTLYAGTLGSTTGIYKTTTDGTSWSQISNGIPAFSNVNCFAAAGSNVFAGTDTGVYSTSNGGILWSPINTGLADSSITVMATTTNYLWAGTNSQGVWRRQLSQLYTSTGEIQPEPSFSIYPNPATTSINIEIPQEFNNSSSNLVQIFNTLGSLVWQKNTSDASIYIDVNDLPKGIYFVKIKNSDMTQTAKFIVQ